MAAAHGPGARERSTHHVPRDPAREEWDVVVVGTGMGGATLGHALAQRGRRVLFLEKGRLLLDAEERGDGRMPLEPDDSHEGRLKRGWWPTDVVGHTSAGRLEFFAPMGCVAGGTTALYAAQLERLWPVDLSPREAHPRAREAALPERWPVSYDELLPYYRRAERLYNVCGTADPLDPDPAWALRPPPPLSARDQQLFDSFRRIGLHPYQAHIGYDFRDGCMECGGALCPRWCKRDAGTTCLVPALERHGASILPECDVLRLDAERSRVTRVVARYRGEELVIRAGTVVLSAGAFNSPAILLASTSAAWPDGIGNHAGLVGRHLMLHASDFVAIRPERAASEEGPKKAMAMNDFYVWQGRKLGTFQSVGIPVTPSYVAYYLRSALKDQPRIVRGLARPAIKGMAYAGAAYWDGAAIFATILEDLPYRENRVVLDRESPNRWRFEYRYPDELRERSRFFRRLLAERLAPHRVAVLTGDDNLNYGHVCGTCRFGHDPATSVLDPQNRVHGVENLYVVDASFFPTSTGTNPSLTIAANALRVAELV